MSLPNSTYGLDVLVRIGYLRDYKRMSYPQIQEALPKHIEVSTRHLRNLYSQYQALLACAERLEVDKLKAAAGKYGGLIVSVDGLEPEGGQPQLWAVREVLTGTLLAAGWIPQVNEKTLKAFLAPVKALDLPILATVSDKQTALINALEKTWKKVPRQYCQAHYLSNAMTPIYDADQHMKTQIRKQVRAKAGKTMRKVQAEAKQKASNDGSALILTGLAVEPPPGLHEIKAIAQAVQESRKGSIAQEKKTRVAATNSCLVEGDPSQEDMPFTVTKVLDRTPIDSSTGIESCISSPEISENIVTTSSQEQSKIDSYGGCLGTVSVNVVAKTTTMPHNDIEKQNAMGESDLRSATIAQKSCLGTQNPIVTEGNSAVVETKESRVITDDSQNVSPAIQTVEDVRTALLGSNVLVHEYRKSVRSKQGPGADVVKKPEKAPIGPSREEMLDQVVEAYAGRLRRVLSRSGRKPFRMAGLRLYADLLALLGSLETSLTYLEDEPRLSCFADAIREALLTYEGQYISIAEGYSWVVDISDILNVPLPEPEAIGPKIALSLSVANELESYLEKLCERTDLDSELLGWRQKLVALTKRYQKGLFHCYDLPGLPRTNNDLESLFGRVRRQTLLTSGPHHAKQRLHEQGAWLLFDVVQNEHEQIKLLQRVSLEEWYKERQRMLAHQATFTADRRFRRQPEKYLADLEARAAEIANLANEG
ncbi:MAG: hypothetical protein ACPGWR_06910 [Ardenticatenaceae bacterium]